MVSISARHAEDPGSIPGCGVFAPVARMPCLSPWLLLLHPMRILMPSPNRMAPRHADRLIPPFLRPSFPALYPLLIASVQIRGSIVVSISACHAEDPGSIPGRGDS